MLGKGPFRGKLRMEVKWYRTVATVGEGSNVSFVRLSARNPIEDSVWIVEKGDIREEYTELFKAISAAHQLNNEKEPEGS